MDEPYNEKRRPFVSAACPAKLRFLLSELIEGKSQFIGFAVRQKIFPGNLPALVSGHTAQHAAECRFNSVCDLVVDRPGHNAGNKCPFLVSIREGQVIDRKSTRLNS